MKIRKLILKGFMRFKEQQELTFPENQVTLIFGENGAGKTSLLDAICVALYGRAFRTSFIPEAGFLTLADLVNHDSQKASIHVEFENYGHNYLVKREISEDGSTGELLEDGEMKAQEGNVFDYVTTKALGLDWEAFIKSTVILQGEMSALTDALPATRKEAFVKLFGLDKYSSYEQIAKVEMEEKNVHIKELEAANEVLTNEVAKITQVERSINRMRKTIAKLEQQKANSGKKVQKLTKLRRDLEKDYKMYVSLNGKIDSLSAQISDLEKRMEGKKSDLDQLVSVQKKFASIKELYDRLAALTESLRRMKPLKSQYDKLQSRINSVELLLNGKREELADIQKDLDIGRTALSKLKRQLPSVTDMKSIREEMTVLERKKVEYEEQRYQVTALIEVTMKTVNELKTNVGKIKRKHVCPVCTQKLPDVKGVLKHYEKEIRTLQTDAGRYQAKLSAITTELRRIDQRLGAVEASRNRLESVYVKQGEIEEETERLDELAERRDKIRAEVTEAVKELGDLRKGLGTLGFNAKEYDKMERKLSSLEQEKVAEKFSATHSQLHQLPKMEREIRNVASMLSKLQKQRDRLLSLIKKFKDIENRFAGAKDALETAESAHEQNMITLTKEQTNYNTLVKQLAELRNKEKRLRRNEDGIEKSRSEMSAFEELMLIFRDIPESILKRLIPNVEKEGTAMVNELSQGTITAINIDPETLSIGATMGGQTRPIQYFSGGQQTRINMALRVAVSKILSRMPHAEAQAFPTMQSLFIDEGDFGNLDESGVRDAMAVIHNLTKEFSRIVLISHLESVRSNFQGYMAEVVKTTPSESTISTPVEAVSM